MTNVLPSVMMCLISGPYCWPVLVVKTPQSWWGAQAAAPHCTSSALSQLTPHCPGNKLSSLSLVHLLPWGPFLGMYLLPECPASSRFTWQCPSSAHFYLMPVSPSWNQSKCPCSSETVAQSSPLQSPGLDGAWLRDGPH